tara:strand:+ start:697 stop:1185 length:489 start_codon:yes stop_codon:yes gene_type:complete
MFSIKFLFLFFAVTLSFSQNIDKNIILNPLMGKKIKLENYLSNGPVLINFWATWCAPCIKEMPYLDQFEKKYKDKGFSVLAVSVDNQKSLSQVRSFIKTKKFSFDIFLDPNMQIFKKLNGNLMPTNVLIDKSGKVVWRHYGYLPGDEKKMEEQILNVLNILP